MWQRQHYPCRLTAWVRARLEGAASAEQAASPLLQHAIVKKVLLTLITWAGGAAMYLQLWAHLPQGCMHWVDLLTCSRALYCTTGQSRSVLICQAAHIWAMVAVKAPANAAGLHGSTKRLSVHQHPGPQHAEHPLACHLCAHASQLVPRALPRVLQLVHAQWGCWRRRAGVAPDLCGREHPSAWGLQLRRHRSRSAHVGIVCCSSCWLIRCLQRTRGASGRV